MRHEHCAEVRIRSEKAEILARVNGQKLYEKKAKNQCAHAPVVDELQPQNARNR